MSKLWSEHFSPIWCDLCSYNCSRFRDSVSFLNSPFMLEPCLTFASMKAREWPARSCKSHGHCAIKNFRKKPFVFCVAFYSIFYVTNLLRSHPPIDIAQQDMPGNNKLSGFFLYVARRWANSVYQLIAFLLTFLS